MKKIISLFPILLIIIFSQNVSVYSKDFSFKYEDRNLSRLIPEDYVIQPPLKISLKNEVLDFSIFSRGFLQGEAVYVEIVSAKMEDIRNITAFYNDKSILLTVKEWGCRGFFAINPNEKTGEKIVKVTYTYKKSQKTEFLNFTVKDAHFKVVTTPLLFDGKYSNAKPLSRETIKYIEECTRKKTAAFATSVPDYINSSMSHPRDSHFFTSLFWSKRVYSKYVVKNGKKVFLKPDMKIHRGIDLRGMTGSPCFALLKGEVVLTDLLYYEGNMVILNHGNGIFSYYMHLSKSLVSKGDIVDAGKQIAEVGSTGRVTGPHLHVSLVINGIQVDPLSMLSLPVRD
ncbi:MAG: M23 family metallopeptidase [Spirochaetes bacterium]|nr:M23 family metallopeptidase [Spirochaetota bacterium]